VENEKTNYLRVNPTEATLEAGQSMTVTCETSYSGQRAWAASHGLTLNSVNSGTVTAKSLDKDEVHNVSVRILGGQGIIAGPAYCNVTVKAAKKSGKVSPLAINPETTVLERGQTVTFSCSPTNYNGYYGWGSSEGLTLHDVGDQYARKVIAPEVTEDVQYSVSVRVNNSNSLIAGPETALVIVKAPKECTDPTASQHPEWSADSSYNGNLKVRYKGLVWLSRNWAAGTPPDESPDWKLESNIAIAWNATKTYDGGKCVNHNGSQYKAGFHAGAGEEPGKASVWTRTGAASCVPR
jgi:chitodextrinase